MRGVPTVLMSPLRQALLECSEFLSYQQLSAIFVDERLPPWQSRLRYADNRQSLVNLTISDFADQRRASGEAELENITPPYIGVLLKQQADQQRALKK